MRQLWQGPLNGTGAQQQYVYCDSTHPHQVTGLYPLGTTCATKGSATATYSASYDAWGNLISRSYNHTTAALSYDVLDELVQWNAGSTSQEWYAYDNAGERILKRSTTNSGTSLTVYAFGNQEHAYNASGVSTGNTYYYSLAGRLIGKFDGGSNTQFFLTDALGSVLSTFQDVANTAAVLGNQGYGPYGNSQYHAGSLGTTKGFTGQYQDTTGLDYYNARYYDPVLGRFVSADTVVGNGQGADPYDYVGGNPETLNDPSGHHPCADDGCSAPSGYFANGGMTNSGWADNPPQLDGGNSSGGGQNYCIGYNCYNSVGQWLYNNYKPPTYHSPSAGSSGGSRPPKSMTKTTSGRGNQRPDWDCDEACFNYRIDRLIFILFGSQRPSTQEVEAACTYINFKNSFTYDTKVTTSKGLQNIGSLKPGEKVKAYNTKTHTAEWEPILHVWVHHDNDLVNLTIVSAAKKGKEVEKDKEIVHTNMGHPFLTVEKGFIPVSDVQIGMHLVAATGKAGIVSTKTPVPGTNVMFNLEVAQDHTFVVGQGQWVVHNFGCSSEIAAFYGFPVEPNANLVDIMSAIPTDAERLSARFLKPTERIPEGGLEVKYYYGGEKVLIRIHGPDSETGNPEGNSAMGWVARIQKGSKNYDMDGNEYPRGAFNPASSNFEKEAANELHIPIEEPMFPFYPDE